MQLTTERLLLRRWRPADREPFAALNADPEVRRYLGPPLDRQQSDDLAETLEQHFHVHRFGFWAVQVINGPSFVGFVGLSHVHFEEHFTPAVEVGWRLASPYWGRGYATEAARAAAEFGFAVLDLEEIVAYTCPANARSRAVMDRLGMINDPADDFDHPSKPPGDPLARQVLYRLSRASLCA